MPGHCHRVRIYRTAVRVDIPIHVRPRHSPTLIGEEAFRFWTLRRSSFFAAATVHRSIPASHENTCLARAATAAEFSMIWWRCLWSDPLPPLQSRCRALYRSGKVVPPRAGSVWRPERRLQCPSVLYNGLCLALETMLFFGG